MSRERFPGEVTYLNTAEWRAAVGAWMAKEGISQADLNRRFKLADGTVSKLLSGKIGKSTLIRPISELAGVPLPKAVSDEAAEISSALAAILESDPIAFEALKALIMRHPGVKRTRG